MGDPIKRDKLETPVIKQYREQGRHGESYTAQRQVPYKQNDDIMRIKRTPGGKPR